MNDFISRGDALAVVQYCDDPVAGIKELPAADLVEVVRCEYCEHYSDGLIFSAPKFCGLTGKAKKCDDFCSEAERKEQWQRWLIDR